MSDKLRRGMLDGSISSKAARKLYTRPGIFQSTKAQQSKMVPFASKEKDEGKPTGNAGALDRDHIDRQSTPSNMSKGGAAGRESQPIKRNQIDDMSVQTGKSDPASRVRARNKRDRFKTKGKIYPSGPLAGGPNGRP